MDNKYWTILPFIVNEYLVYKIKEINILRRSQWSIEIDPVGRHTNLPLSHKIYTDFEEALSDCKIYNAAILKEFRYGEALIKVVSADPEVKYFIRIADEPDSIIYNYLPKTYIPKQESVERLLKNYLEKRKIYTVKDENQFKTFVLDFVNSNLKDYSINIDYVKSKLNKMIISDFYPFKLIIWYYNGKIVLGWNKKYWTIFASTKQECSIKETFIHKLRYKIKKLLSLFK